MSGFDDALFNSDIGHCHINSGNADAERAVAFLPFERTHSRKYFMDPFRRISSEKLQRHGHGHGWRERDQHVHVVSDSAYCNRFHFLFSGDTAQIRPKTLLQIGF
jgi:hypothetical protein